MQSGAGKVLAPSAVKDFRNREGGDAYGFEEIRYETRIESSEPPERIRELVEEAERHCYVLSTFKRAVKISARILLNGAPFMEIEHKPE